MRIDPAPKEVGWSVPLGEDYEHARYDTGTVGDYFAAATQAALTPAAFRAPYRGRSTPVNVWSGSFDLAVVRRLAELLATSPRPEITCVRR